MKFFLFKIIALTSLAFGVVAHGRSERLLKVNPKSSKRLPKGEPKGSKPRVLTNIDLGNVRPGSCIQGNGTEIYVTELYFGGVNKVNLVTGEINPVVPGYGYIGFIAKGVLPFGDYLLVIGAPTPSHVFPQYYLYNITTGEKVGACPTFYRVPPFPLSDVVIVGDNAYFTASQSNVLLVTIVELAKHGVCQFTSINLPADTFFDPAHKKMMASGIVAFGGGLVISNFDNGGLFFVDLETKKVTQIASATDAPTTDGLRLADNLLYAVESYNNRVAVWKLSRNNSAVTAVRQGYLHSPLFDTPTSAAVFDDWLFVCNARFGSIGQNTSGEEYSNFTQHFSLVGVNRFAYT